MINTIQARYGAIFDATIGKLWVTRIWDSIDRDLPSNRQTISRADILLAAVFGLLGIAASVWAFTQTHRAPGLHTLLDIYLNSDVPAWEQNFVSTDGMHSRTSVHPIISILLYPFGALLTSVGVDPLSAAKTLIVVIMGANVALFTLITRLLGLPRSVGAAFSMLFLISAGFLFWSGVVESYPFACFSVLLALFMMLRVRSAHWSWWIAVNVLTLGFLITNWMFGLIAMAVRLKLKPFLAISVSSFFIVVALSVIQNATFEKAAFFFNPEPILREARFFQPIMEVEGSYEEDWRPVSNLRSIYVTSVVAMPVYLQEFSGYHVATTNQNSSLPEGELSPVLAIISWVVLFGMGVWGAAKRREIGVPLIGAALMLGFQTALHIIYGEVTFLYSLNFLPLLLMFACLSWYAPYRSVAVGLVSCVILFGGLNNERRLQETIDAADCLSEIDSVRNRQDRERTQLTSPQDNSDDSRTSIESINSICNTKSPS